MIIIGYQGIGKSTLAGKCNTIDLESTNFWYNGKRSLDWYIPYCNIAEDLSRQGYTVFVSSHEAVRNRLKKSCGEPVCAIVPALCLRDEWKEKLKARWEQSKSDKDYKAWQNAVDRYDDNIKEIINSGLPYHIIEEMNYSLKGELEKVKWKLKNAVSAVK